MLSSRVKSFASWISLVSSAASLAILVYVRWVWRFEDFETPHFLAGLALLLTPITLVTGLIGLPRWRSIVAIIFLGVVAYFFSFTQLFCCEV